MLKRMVLGQARKQIENLFREMDTEELKGQDVQLHVANVYQNKAAASAFLTVGVSQKDFTDLIEEAKRKELSRR